MTCVHVEEVCKTPGEIRDYSIRWTNETFNFWASGEQYSLADRVRPSVANGYEYQCSQAGQTAQSTEETDAEPIWPTTLGGAVTDGSVIWTAVAISTTGLRKTIASSTWTVEDESIEVEDSTFVSTAGKQSTSVKISGGDDGEVWDAVNHVVFSDGTELDAILRVTIEDQAD